MKLRMIFGVLALVALACGPMLTLNPSGTYLFTGHGLLLTFLVMAVVTWDRRCQSILESFGRGTLCMLISLLVWPLGWLLLFAVPTLGFGYASASQYLQGAAWVLVGSSYGGLIGVVCYLTIPKQKLEAAETPTTSEDSPGE